MVSSESGGADGVIGWSDAGKPLRGWKPIGRVSNPVQKARRCCHQGEIDVLVSRSEASTSDDEEAPYVPLSDDIVYDDFAKLDLRVGQITGPRKF